MRFLPDWQLILRKAWSIRLMLLAGLLTGLEIILPLFADGIPRNTFAVLSFVTVGAALVARLLAQSEQDSQ